MEAPSGFEPENRGFAVPCLTTWLWRRRRFVSSDFDFRLCREAKICILRNNLLSNLKARFQVCWKLFCPRVGRGKISTLRNTLLSKLNPRIQFCKERGGENLHPAKQPPLKLESPLSSLRKAVLPPCREGARFPPYAIRSSQN